MGVRALPRWRSSNFAGKSELCASASMLTYQRNEPRRSTAALWPCSFVSSARLGRSSALSACGIAGSSLPSAAHLTSVAMWSTRSARCFVIGGSTSAAAMFVRCLRGPRAELLGVTHVGDTVCTPSDRNRQMKTHMRALLRLASRCLRASMVAMTGHSGSETHLRPRRQHGAGQRMLASAALSSRIPRPFGHVHRGPLPAPGPLRNLHTRHGAGGRPIYSSIRDPRFSVVLEL